MPVLKVSLIPGSRKRFLLVRALYLSLLWSIGMHRVPVSCLTPENVFSSDRSRSRKDRRRRPDQSESSIRTVRLAYTQDGQSGKYPIIGKPLWARPAAALKSNRISFTNYRAENTQTNFTVKTDFIVHGSVHSSFIALIPLAISFD